MIVISNKEVETLLPMNDAIDVVASTMIEVSSGNTTLPLRSIMSVGASKNLGIMPGAMENPPCYGVKMVSLFPENPKSGYSSHQGAMVLYEPINGSAVAIMNADLLTAIRTAAASGVATKELARDDSSRLAIIGYGEQAKYHLDAMVAVRPITDAIIAGRNSDRAGAFVASAQARFPDITVSYQVSVQNAVNKADIVCTVTAADEPILFGDWVAPGTHLNIVGSSIPSKREIDIGLVLGSSYFVDYRPSTMAQAGEFILAIEEEQITPAHIRAEIGEVLAGRENGRTKKEEITLYRSLGIAAQDIACAHYVQQKAIKLGKGITASLD